MCQHSSSSLDWPRKSQAICAFKKWKWSCSKKFRCRCLSLGYLQLFNFTLKYWWIKYFYSAICQSVLIEKEWTYFTSLISPCARCDMWTYHMKYLCVSIFWVADGKNNCSTWQASSVFGRLPSQHYGKYPGLLL